MSRTAGWVLLALAGLAIAVALSLAAGSLSTQPIGLSGEALRPGERLAPTTTTTTTRAKRSPKHSARTRTTTTPTTTTPTTTGAEPGDDHGGRRGRGRGSDD